MNGTHPTDLSVGTPPKEENFLVSNQRPLPWRGVTRVTGWVFVLLLLITCQTLASTTTFLYNSVKENLGVEQLGMGASGVGSTQGARSVFYNPAGLAGKGSEFVFEQLDTSRGSTAGHQAYFLQLGSLGIANWKTIGLIGQEAEVTALSYAKSGRRGIDWGATYKFIRQNESSIQEMGWSSDVGVKVHVNQYVDVGIVAQDVFKSSIGIPLSLRLGTSFFNPTKEWIVNADFVQTRDPAKSSSVQPRLGAQYALTDGFSVSGGWYDQMFTGGVGMALSFAILEGSVTIPTDARPNSYAFGIRFGRSSKPASDKRYSMFQQHAYAVVQLDGNLIEGKSEISLLGGAKVGMNDLIQYVESAANDPSCDGIIVRIGSLNGSLGTIALVQELRSALIAAKKNDKKIYVYLENWASLSDYYLASCADRIFMPSLGTLSHLGLDFEVRKTKDLFEKFGIGNEVIASGKYKAMLNPNTGLLNESEKLKLEDTLDGLYHQVLTDIRQDRPNVDWEKAGPMFDGRIISATQAKELGLIDQLGYFDSLKESLKKKPIVSALPTQDAVIVGLDQFEPYFGPDTLLSEFNKVAVVEIDGSINLGQNGSNFLFGGKSTGSDEVSALIESIANDFTIRAVVLRINSPGGSIVASDMIYEAINRLHKAKKLVYTSMGNVAASGGYYVALNSDKIFANPGTLTGSIGVISQFRNFEEFNKIFGIKTQHVKTGKYMDLFSGSKKMSGDEKSMLREYQTKQYEGFVEKVMRHRQISRNEIYTLAQGQIFTGKEAKELHLVDEIGTFQDTVKTLSKDAKILGKPKLVFYRSETPSLLQYLMNRLFG